MIMSTCQVVSLLATGSLALQKCRSPRSTPQSHIRSPVSIPWALVKAVQSVLAVWWVSLQLGRHTHGQGSRRCPYLDPKGRKEPFSPLSLISTFFGHPKLTPMYTG